MAKPLSPKTLEKKYAELGMSQGKIDLLHDYFLCFSHLYGVISVRDAWNVFKNYEGSHLLHERDFIAFSGIVQREAGHPYTVLELKEVYTGETTEDPSERLIVNNYLIGSGYRKYELLYNTVEKQLNKPYYLPPEKSVFLSYVKDLFFLSPEGKQMAQFFSGLKTDGQYKDFNRKSRGDILDMDGTSVSGKRMSDFVCYTPSEQFDIDYAKNEKKKEQLRQKYKTTALDKILSIIFIGVQTGGYLPNDNMAETLSFLTDYLDEELGVSFTQAQFNRFCKLYMDLNNRSHLWLNRGWRPDELMFMGTSGRPQAF